MLLMSNEFQLWLLVTLDRLTRTDAHTYTIQQLRHQCWASTNRCDKKIMQGSCIFTPVHCLIVRPVKQWSGYYWFICAFAFLLSTFHSHRTVDRCRYWPSSSETAVYGLDHWLYLCNEILFKWLILSLVWPTQSEVITLKLVYCFGFSRTVCI